MPPDGHNVGVAVESEYSHFEISVHQSTYFDNLCTTCMTITSNLGNVELKWPKLFQAFDFPLSSP